MRESENDSMIGVALQGSKEVRVRSFDLPRPSYGEVIIKVATAGICGSDLRFYRQTREELGPRFDVVIGHEPGGVVESVGHGVSRFLAGDRVVVNHTIGCGKCSFCQEGATALCRMKTGMAEAGRGADTEFCAMPETNCDHIPNDISNIDASFLACTGATAYGVISKLNIQGGNTMAIFGLGPVGLSILLLARAFGIRIFGVDINPRRLDLARDLGTLDSVNPSQDDPETAIRSFTNGKGADYVVETSGAITARSAAVRSAAVRGIVVYVGMGGDSVALPISTVIQNELRIFGSKVLPFPQVSDLVQFMREKRIRFEEIVTRTFEFEEASVAFAEFDEGHPGKFILRS